MLSTPLRSNCEISLFLNLKANSMHSNLCYSFFLLSTFSKMVPFKPRSLIVVCHLTCWGLNQLQRVCFKHWYARIVFLKSRFYSCRKFDLLIIFFLIQNFLDISINISSLIVKFPNYWAKTKLNMLPGYSTFCLEFFSNRNHKALFIWRKIIV